MTREENYEQTLLTLANASYLGAQIVLQARGERMADHVKNDKVTLDMARGMILSRIRARFKIKDQAAQSAAEGSGVAPEGTNITGVEPETPAAQ